MAKMIQLRHVPDSVHRNLKSRAAKKGMSLSDYLVREVTQLAQTSSLEEMSARLAARQPVHFKEPTQVTIRKVRDGR